jgi:hypothetical protein
MARPRVASFAGQLSGSRVAKAGAAATAAALLAAGCGTSTKVVDASTVRPVIDKQIQASGAPAARSVSCPVIDAANGKTLTCEVTLRDGSAYDMTIRVDSVASQRPLLTVVAARLLTIGSSNVKPMIDDQLNGTHVGAAKAIICEHVAAKVGATFTCTVHLESGHVITDGFTLQTLGATGPTFLIKTLSTK